MSTARSRALPSQIATVLALLAAAAVFTYAVRGNLEDLREMYCAGRVLTAGGDPYLFAPMYRCELAYVGLRPSIPVFPAPLPPFVLSLFAFARFCDFSFFAFVFVAAALGAGYALVRFAAHLSGTRLLTSALVFLWFVVTAISQGQLSVFGVAAIAGAAWSWQRARATAAALFVLAALIQPTIAGPPLLLLLLFGTVRSRIVLLAGACVIAVVSFALGIGLTLEYFRLELPAQALAEIVSSQQLSAAWFFHAIGVPEIPALRLGSASYAISAALGIGGGAIFVRRGQRDIGLLFAAAMATFGGTYVHAAQVQVALLLGLALAVRSPRYGFAAALATGALSAVWFVLPKTFLDGAIDAVASCATAGAAVALILGGTSWPNRTQRGVAFVFAGVLVVLASSITLLAPPPYRTNAVFLNPSPDAHPALLASTVWGEHQRWLLQQPFVKRMVLEKSIPFAAFVTILGLAIATIRRDGLRPAESAGG